MTELQKDDIPILDFIINELCKTGIYSVDVEYLKNKQVFGFGKNEYKSVDDLAFGEEKEFRRLLHIIEEFDCADVNLNKYFNGQHNVSENKKTLNFKKLGGFKNEFKKQKKTLDWYKIIPICIAIIFGSLSAFQKYSYNSLNVKFENLKDENFSLKSELDSLKTNLTDMRSKENLNKEKSILDTLKTKKESYLKNE